MSVGQESEGGAEDHPLALLDRYTLAIVEEQYQQGLLERECTQHAPHLRVAYYLKDVLAWKRLLPCELYQVSMPNMREKNTESASEKHRKCASISVPTLFQHFFPPFMFPPACAVATNLLVPHTDMGAREREGHCLGCCAGARGWRAAVATAHASAAPPRRAAQGAAGLALGSRPRVREVAGRQ